MLLVLHIATIPIVPILDHPSGEERVKLIVSYMAQLRSWESVIIYLRGDWQRLIRLLEFLFSRGRGSKITDAWRGMLCDLDNFVE